MSQRQCIQPCQTPPHYGQLPPRRPARRSAKKHIFVIISIMMLAAVWAGAASGSQPASASTVIGIASCRSNGGFAICTASGTARHSPGNIVVHVRATPRQSVDVAWDLTCSRGTSGSSNSGQFSSGTPINRTLRHSLSRPDSCIVAATGQLNHSGSLHLWLTYTSWR